MRYEPDYVDARLRLSELLGRADRFEQSLAQYREVLRIDPGVADARFGDARALVGLRRYGKAGESVGEAVKLHPDQPRFAEALT